MRAPWRSRVRRSLQVWKIDSIRCRIGARCGVLPPALEGIAFGVRHNLEVMAPGDDVRAVAVGGGTKGALWTQIVSDVTGVAQIAPRETIGACYGDALLAGEGVGLVPSGSSWATPSAVVQPNLGTRESYDGLYRELYPATKRISTSWPIARSEVASSAFRRILRLTVSGKPLGGRAIRRHRTKRG